ncbi:MAG: hypothetical protein A4S09_00280 [Proteobacteria bacterium SG_bin7]|nr:MAG: hypothetical protein A4S09_00280 [Proteobacteria bacterium SG_bin7]
MKKLNSIYFVFSYPMVVFAWLLMASVANSATKKELYRCVIIDPSLAEKGQPVEKYTRVFYQEAGSTRRYVSNGTPLDFDFKEVPMKVSIKNNGLTEKSETPTTFRGYDEESKIEINCDKKLRDESLLKPVEI